jgi:hypothetical protein
MAGGIIWLCFGPMYQLSFAAGFVSLVLALAFAYAQVGVMYARVSGAQQQVLAAQVHAQQCVCLSRYSCCMMHVRLIKGVACPGSQQMVS